MKNWTVGRGGGEGNADEGVLECNTPTRSEVHCINSLKKIK